MFQNYLYKVKAIKRALIGRVAPDKIRKTIFINKNACNFELFFYIARNTNGSICDKESMSDRVIEGLSGAALTEYNKAFVRSDKRQRGKVSG